jgi:hypothetical protein
MDRTEKIILHPAQGFVQKRMSTVAIQQNSIKHASLPRMESGGEST